MAAPSVSSSSFVNVLPAPNIVQETEAALKMTSWRQQRIGGPFAAFCKRIKNESKENILDVLRTLFPNLDSDDEKVRKNGIDLMIELLNAPESNKENVFDAILAFSKANEHPNNINCYLQKPIAVCCYSEALRHMTGARQTEASQLLIKILVSASENPDIALRKVACDELGKILHVKGLDPILYNIAISYIKKAAPEDLELAVIYFTRLYIREYPIEDIYCPAVIKRAGELINDPKTLTTGVRFFGYLKQFGSADQVKMIPEEILQNGHLTFLTRVEADV